MPLRFSKHLTPIDKPPSPDAMTPDELLEVLGALGLSVSAAARLLGVNDRTVRRWSSGDAPLPPPATRFSALTHTAPRSRRKRSWRRSADEPSDAASDGAGDSAPEFSRPPFTGVRFRPSRCDIHSAIWMSGKTPDSSCPVIANSDHTLRRGEWVKTTLANIRCARKNKRLAPESGH